MRRHHDLAFAALPARFDKLEGRVHEVETGLAENTALTERVHTDTSSLVVFMRDVEAVWRVCKFFRTATLRAAKWTAAVGVAFTATWAAVKTVGNIDLTKMIVDWWAK